MECRCFYPISGPVDGVQMHRGVERRQPGPVMDVEGDRFIDQLVYEIRLPVPLQPGGTVIEAKKPLISSGACGMNSRYHFMMAAA